MEAERVNLQDAALLDPGHSVWAGVAPAELGLSEAPLGMQPSPWMQGAYAERAWGGVASARLRAVHNGDTLAFHVTWSADTKATSSVGAGDFPDACAIMLPFVPDAPIFMGGEDAWVNMWLWRADGVGPFALTSAGIGTTERVNDGAVRAAAAYAEGAWNVVLARALEPPSTRDHVPLAVGRTWQVSLCVWQGARGERAGLKSFSPAWTELVLPS